MSLGNENAKNIPNRVSRILDSLLLGVGFVAMVGGIIGAAVALCRPNAYHHRVTLGTTLLYEYDDTNSSVSVPDHYWSDWNDVILRGLNSNQRASDASAASGRRP